MMDSTATIDFCGERYVVSPSKPFIIGRDGDLTVDDNPYLHRRFLQLSDSDSLWVLSNLGTQLSATIADENSTLQAWLAPGASLPMIFPRNIVWFTAGPTTYEFEVLLAEAPYAPVIAETADNGITTVGRVSLTPDQRLLVIALCEQSLRRGEHGASAIPSSADAARRLGWALTKFNRKLDNVCQKLAREGVRGLHGGPEKLAVNRRARLVEYALASRMVEKADLALLNHTAG
jgi:hypothetical protein